MLYRKLTRLAIPLGLCVLMAATPKPPPLAPCEVASEWVKRNAGHLPSGLTAFESHDDAHRRAIYDALSGGQKFSLWNEHFSAIKSKETFSAEQLRFFDETERLLSAVLRSKRGRLIEGTPEYSTAKQMAFRAKELFGPSLALSIFSLGVRSEVLATSRVPEGKPLEDCDCSHSSAFDSCEDTPGWLCWNNGGSRYKCEHQNSGCGFAWLWDCDGLCAPIN